MKQKFTPYIYILFSALFLNLTYGQKLELNISAIDSTSKIILQNVHHQEGHFTENSLLKSLDSVQLKIERMGFINFRLDSLTKRPSSNERPPSNSLSRRGDTLVQNNFIYTAYFNLRNQIKTIRIYYDDDELKLDQLTWIDIKKSSGHFEIKPESLSEKLQNITKILEKKGNSFSEVTLKNILIKNDSLIEANLFIKKSTLRKIDKIIIEGYASFPEAYLKHHLRFEKNSLFSKEKLNKASTVINVIPFVSEIKTPEVLFTKDSTIVYLYLKKENANKFDGLIGFTSKESGKGLSFNGYLDLSLNNLFNSGENFNLVWKNNGNNRQVFNLDVSLPYILNSKLSPKGVLNIYKQDSSFVNTLFKFSLPYVINNRNAIGFMIQSESSSNLLTSLNENIEDFKSLFYGLNYNYNIINNHPLFRTKFNFYTEIMTGKRKATTNNNQSRLFLKTNYLWSLNIKNHIFIQNQSGSIESKKYIDNELLRIGGTNSIRGFDEESILASTYSMLNIEYRYNTQNNSYLYSITDLGYFKNNNLSSQLYAFGLGYAFTSKLGFVNLSYALGKSSDIPFNFSNSRFHIKFVNSF